MGSPATRFRVGAEVKHVYGGGTLIVGPDAIVLECSRPTRAFSGVAQIVHTDRDVILVKPRLVPPWYNTSLVLHGKEGSGCAITSVLARQRLRNALTASGYDVREVTTVFSLHGAGRRNTSPQKEWPHWLSRRLRIGLTAASVVAAAGCVLVVSHAPVFIAVVVAGVVLNSVALFR